MSVQLEPGEPITRLTHVGTFVAAHAGWHEPGEGIWWIRGHGSEAEAALAASRALLLSAPIEADDYFASAYYHFPPPAAWRLTDE